jgi:hypothetical protein
MRSRSRKVLLAAIAAFVLVAGASFAAIRATHDAKQRPRTTLAAASSYLGVSEAQLRSDLGSGKSLAQVASATAGRSPAGLIEAIVAARSARLQELLAGLRSHVTAEVERSGTRPSARASMGSVAAAYLGLPVAQLRARRRAGQTLARIADSIPGRSRAGLVAALVAARREALSMRVAAGLLTPAREQTRLARVQRLVGERVDGVRHQPHAAGHARRGGP